MGQEEPSISVAACGIFSYGMQSQLRHVGPSSLTRDRTWAPALGMQSLSHRTIREVPLPTQILMKDNSPLPPNPRPRPDPFPPLAPSLEVASDLCSSLARSCILLTSASIVALFSLGVSIFLTAFSLIRTPVMLDLRLTLL